MVSTVWSVSCSLFFYSRCPPCPTIYKSGVRAPPVSHGQRIWIAARSFIFFGMESAPAYGLWTRPMSDRMNSKSCATATGMRILVTLLLDTLPMLGNVLMLCFFVFFIFGIIGVQLWSGLLRNRCFLDLPANISTAGYARQHFQNTDILYRI